MPAPTAKPKRAKNKMELKEIIQKASDSKHLYGEYEKNRFGKSWNSEETYISLVSDVGDLGRVVLTEMPGSEQHLRRELAECLWGICVLAKNYDIDLESAFIEELKNIERRIQGS